MKTLRVLLATSFVVGCDDDRISPILSDGGISACVEIPLAATTGILTEIPVQFEDERRLKVRGGVIYFQARFVSQSCASASLAPAADATIYLSGDGAASALPDSISYDAATGIGRWTLDVWPGLDRVDLVVPVITDDGTGTDASVVLFLR